MRLRRGLALLLAVACVGAGMITAACGKSLPLEDPDGASIDASIVQEDVVLDDGAVLPDGAVVSICRGDAAPPRQLGCKPPVGASNIVCEEITTIVPSRFASKGADASVDDASFISVPASLTVDLPGGPSFGVLQYDVTAAQINQVIGEFEVQLLAVGGAPLELARLSVRSTPTDAEQIFVLEADALGKLRVVGTLPDGGKQIETSDFTLCLDAWQDISVKIRRQTDRIDFTLGFGTPDNTRPFATAYVVGTTNRATINIGLSHNGSAPSRARFDNVQFYLK